MGKSSFNWDISNNKELRVLIRSRKYGIAGSNKKIIEKTEKTLDFLKIVIKEADFEQRNLIEGKIRKHFVSDLYLNFFEFQKNVTVRSLLPDRGTIGDFIGEKPSTERPHDLTLDFFAVFLGYAGIKGYLDDTTLDDCFQFSKINDLELEREIYNFLIPERTGKRLAIEQHHSMSPKLYQNVVDENSEKIKEDISPFSINELGILILGFDGDKENELQLDLVSTLHEELDPELNYEIKHIRTSINTQDGLKDAQIKAKEFGKRIKAKFVIWGNVITNKKVHARITITDNLDPIVMKRKASFSKDDKGYIYDNYILNAGEISNFNLPDQLIKKPYVLVNFIKGYEYFNDKEFNKSISFFESIISTNWEDIVSRNNMLMLIGMNYTLLAAITNNTYDYSNKANTYYKKILEGDQQNISALANRATTYRISNRLSISLEDYNRVLEIDYGFIGALKGRAITHFLIGNFDKSLEDFNHYLETNNNDLSALLERARVFIAMNNIKDARKDLSYVINSNPSENQLWVNIGGLFIDIGDFRSAINGCKKAIELDAKDDFAYINLGNAYSKTGFKDNAIECYAKSIQLNQNDFLARYNLAKLFYDQNKYQKAEEVINLSIKQNPNYYQSHLQLAWILLDTDRKDQSRDSLIRAVKLKRYDSPTWYAIGYYHFLNQRHKRAYDCYRYSINLNIRNSDPWNGIGQIHMDKGNLNEAMKCFNKSYDLNPNDYINLNSIGITFSLLGNSLHAIRMFEKSLKICKTDYKTWFNLSVDNYYIKNYERTISCLNEAVKLNPEHVKSWDLFGESYKMLGDEMMTKSSFEKARKIQNKNKKD